MSESHKKRTGQNAYLWDRKGEPDAEIQGLEQALEEFRATSLDPPAFPALDSTPQPSSWRLAITSIAWVPRFAAATLTLAAITIALFLSSRESTTSSPNNSWSVELSEAQSDGSLNAGAPKRRVQMQIGEAFETDRTSRANIAVADIGRLELGPMTRLRLLQSTEGRKRVALDRGTIHAIIWAPPGEFVMDTPSAVAVDLGCMYTLHIDETGSGLLQTTLGWVGFRSNGHESFIPAGAAAATYAQTGPGLPYFEDASDTFHSAVLQFDSAKQSSAQRPAALQVILRDARPRDGLTLWHLLSRVSEVDRPAVYDRLAALIPPPPGATREGILHLDRAMLDSWWNALDIGDIGLWRRWERSWAGQEGRQK
jgi:ferric-dicitrate binding protein FerR (iron transport regulator)